jgi:hypothetical protein
MDRDLRTATGEIDGSISYDLLRAPHNGRGNDAFRGGRQSSAVMTIGWKRIRSNFLREMMIRGPRRAKGMDNPSILIDPPS